MKLSIIIPTYNEEKFIEETIKKVFSSSIPCPIEVIIIDDGSADQTNEILEKLKSFYNFKHFRSAKNLGKGSAIKTGLSMAEGNLIIIQDADLEYDPKEIPVLLASMENDVWAVYGKRHATKRPNFGFYYVLGAYIITSTINILYGTKLRDSYTGYKLFNIDKMGKELLTDLKSTGFEFEAEVTCSILNKKGKIIEVGIDYTPRSKQEGKHIGLSDAFKGFSTILKCYTNRM